GYFLLSSPFTREDDRLDRAQGYAQHQVSRDSLEGMLVRARGRQDRCCVKARPLHAPYCDRRGEGGGDGGERGRGRARPPRVARRGGGPARRRHPPPRSKPPLILVLHVL